MKKLVISFIIITLIVTSYGIISYDYSNNIDTDNDGYNNSIENNVDILDPEKKNVVVRVKYGKNVTEQNLSKVVTKYDKAPVSNPDGTNGINLILLNETEYNSINNYYTLKIVEDIGIDGFAGYTIEGNDRMLVENRDYKNYLEFNFMHELGHNLGLNASMKGVDSHNYTYNEYPSVMNYNTDKTILKYDTGVMRNEWDIIEENLNK